MTDLHHRFRETPTIVDCTFDGVHVCSPMRPDCAGCQAQSADLRATYTLTLLSRVMLWVTLEGMARRGESPDADLVNFTIGVLRHFVFVSALDRGLLRVTWGCP